MFKHIKRKIIKPTLSINHSAFIICLLSLAISHWPFIIRPAYALTMSDPNYLLQMDNLNMSAGRPSGANYKLTNTTGQTAPGLNTGTNYQVKSDFEYIYPIQNFTFSISQ